MESLRWSSCVKGSHGGNAVATTGSNNFNRPVPLNAVHRFNIHRSAPESIEVKAGNRFRSTSRVHHEAHGSTKFVKTVWVHCRDDKLFANWVCSRFHTQKHLQ